MRTIKFRGKTELTGEWVYGFFSMGSSVRFEHPKQDERVVPRYLIDDGLLHDVIPETVGQFTGLHDKNGKEIYEGDILKMGNCDFRGVVQWHKNGYFYINEYYPKVIDDDYSPLGNMLRYDMDVIGNVFDNHELMEEGGEQ